MSQTLTLELSDRQREILLRGLRFVRRSRMLDFRDTSDLSEEARAAELQDVQQLNALIEGVRTAKQPAAVG